MDFFAYYDGIVIESFSSTNPRTARRYLNRRYENGKTVVLIPVNSTREQFEEARQRSVDLAAPRT